MVCVACNGLVSFRWLQAEEFEGEQSGAVPGAVATPQAAGIWAISSLTWAVSCPACWFRVAMLSSRIRA